MDAAAEVDEFVYNEKLEIPIEDRELIFISTSKMGKT